ncbi:MAG: hypothetical protein JW712_14745 [Dehalococcoidales bacterium]|nr:hypothetical protein [Dehalococcoidales bacterium]
MLIFQKLQRSIAFFLSVVFLLSIVGAAGCGQDTTTSASIIQGWICAEDAVTDASLLISDFEGKTLFETNTPATGKSGAFLVSADDIPSEFRIVTSGGTVNGIVFTSELKTDVQGFDSDKDVIFINLVTTIISAYRDLNPEIAVDDATTKVTSYLGIPEWVSTSAGLQVSTEYFSSLTFLNEARDNGGVDAFIKTIAGEIDQNTTSATRSFKSEGGGLLGGSNGLLGGAGTFIAKGLANGALSYVGGNVLGWGLSMFGLGSEDKTAEELEKISKQIEQLQQSMDEMKQQLTEISHKLDSLESQMQQMGAQLSNEIKQTDYDTRVGQMISLINSIKSIKNQVTIFVSNPPTDPKVLDYQRTKIMTRIENEILNHGSDINSQLTGIGMSTPLLKIWSQIVKNGKTFLSADDSATVQSQFDYFDNLQLWLTELVVEYYHAKATNEEDGSAMYTAFVNDANDAVINYNTNRASQVALLLPALPSGVLYNANLNILILPQVFHATWIEKNSRHDYGRPPTVIPNCPFPSWRSASEAQLTTLFHLNFGGSPHTYAINQGWPKTEISAVWTLGLGYYNGDNTKIKLGSLIDGTTRVIDQASTEQVDWVMVVEPWIIDPATDDDSLVKFFW